MLCRVILKSICDCDAVFIWGVLHFESADAISFLFNIMHAKIHRLCVWVVVCGCVCEGVSVCVIRNKENYKVWNYTRRCQWFAFKMLHIFQVDIREANKLDLYQHDCLREYGEMYRKWLILVVSSFCRGQQICSNMDEMQPLLIIKSVGKACCTTLKISTHFYIFYLLNLPHKRICVHL